MKYIIHTERGWDYGPYWNYLKTANIPPAAHAFAANKENHELTNPNSLHDSWLEQWCVSEIGNGKYRNTQIRLTLLGQTHDRLIHLTYGRVYRYVASAADLSPRGCGDLLVHELRANADGHLVHEMLFASGAEMQVEFQDFNHEIVMR